MIAVQKLSDRPCGGRVPPLRVTLVMDLFTRRIVGFGVESTCIDGISLCRMFYRASIGQRLPSNASSDNDPLFRFYRWLANLRVLEIEEIKSVPYAPLSSVRRTAIGTVRREYLDRVFFWTAVDLARKLANSEIITMRIVSTARSIALHPRNAPAHPHPRWPR
jgi:hypothetical protein